MEALYGDETAACCDEAKSQGDTAMSKSFVPAKTLRSFAELAAAYDEGVDYRITCMPRAESTVGVVAPHGGRIERCTSDIATAIAGAEFSLYLMEGVRPAENYEALHLTSHYFDDPRCLEMLAVCEDVVTVHGCKGAREAVFIGGLDDGLASELSAAIANAGIECHLEGHDFPATHPNNICNRGRRGRGAQLELSLALRISPRKRSLVDAVRDVLLRRSDCHRHAGHLR